ncbi:MAG TPA: trypsin-like peptidase domain-containing protein [Planctomycetota bacterium]|nr:trypsin-like peptidase domain-containing protein [Planctomycetota bacterium]
MPERRFSRSICALAFSGLLPVLFVSFPSRAGELVLLNQIRDRHERMHQQVAPAVVAVEARNAKPQKERDKDSAKFYGTGVVVSPDGMVLTSSTVVPAAARFVSVYFTDGRVMDAKVVAIDEATESCVLQAIIPQADAKKPLAYVELADSSKVNVGELAYTAGNPFHTITRDGQVAWSIGTISGRYNIASADEQSRYRGLVLETDAAVNPGSDGGPLIDANGRLLGILSLCFCESRWLGTAIPVHLIHQNLQPLRALSLVEPRTAPRPALTDNSVPVKYETDDGAGVARAVPDAMRIVSRPAAKAIVRLHIKRSDSGRDTQNERKTSLARRLRKRPDAPVSGVIVEPDGHIITSAFNVDGDVVSIETELCDGTRRPARLLGRNLGLDVAVLKIDPPNNELLPAIPLATDPNLQIGRFVTVLGASEDGTGPTQTGGIVSALARLDGCAVQTDALINYGNSGGPVVDLRGRLIGIAAFVRTHADWSQQNSGVGFFTQSDKILECLADLKAGRDIKAPVGAFLGVRAADNALDVKGVKLDKIVPGSAADQAKLQPGDIITCLDGMDTHSWPALVRVLKAHKPGDTVEITFQRGTVTSTAKVVLAARKDGQ